MKPQKNKNTVARKNAILGFVLAGCAMLLASSVFVWQFTHRQPASVYQSEIGE